ncbi:tRNA (adenosine(37)-N6)-threonylcarbamoyltransferase complex dimerization subunit type 1 TsaB [Chitinimonas sp.]|uniref:tRNA (adenosine(37)-N6)-threonylcarbamoyltransferase complex dimerization subunit type 1 TsaB n=1 Tax=Chitinimonas sp. TaxID=1934313 RepID=UPI0035B052D3
MNLLALDTSTEYLSLALRYRGELLTREWHAQQKHAEMTLPELQKLMADAGATLSELDGIALSVGPGSFTGLRIGCGIAQGLAYGLGIPTVAVNTLAALAADCEAERVLAVLDARMNELYLAGFERQTSGWQEVVATTVVGPAALPELPGAGWHGVGSGFAVAGDALAQRYGSQLGACDGSRFPHARGVLALAEPQFARGETLPADRLELLYIRDKVALKTSERVKA